MARGYQFLQDGDAVLLADVERRIVTDLFPEDLIEINDDNYHRAYNATVMQGFSILMKMGGGHVTEEKASQWLEQRGNNDAKELLLALMPYLDGRIYEFHAWG